VLRMLRPRGAGRRRRGPQKLACPRMGIIPASFWAGTKEAHDAAESELAGR
jgi:hypothetical protein